MASTRTATSLGPIQPGTLYPLPAFKRITGFGNHAMRTARRNGLRVRYLSGRAFVHSDDFYAHLERCDADEIPGSSPR